MAAAVADACDGTLDGLVAGAGIMEGGPGAHRVGELLRRRRNGERTAPVARSAAAGRSAVVISSNSTTTQPALAMEVVAACLADDEDAARETRGEAPTLRLRRVEDGARPLGPPAAVGPEWAGAGLRLNAIAPGLIETPMTARRARLHPWARGCVPDPAGPPRPTPRRWRGSWPISFRPTSSFFTGSFVIMDGGTDAAVRTTDWPSPRQ